MSLPSGLKHLPIEYMSLDNTIPLAVLLLGFLQLCLYMILDWDNKIYSFFLGSDKSSSFREQSSDELKKPGKILGGEINKKEKIQVSEVLVKQRPSFGVKKDEESVSAQDVDLVFKSLGLMLNNNPDDHDDGARTLEEGLNCNGLLNLFEEKDPSEDEVKATFDVFDENKDGFIDARELQRLLCALGLTEGSQLENCTRMIRAVDDNGDDKIDFHEFVKFMESSFC